MIANKNYYLFISAFCLFLSILFALPIAGSHFFINNKAAQLYIILITIAIQIPFIFKIKKQYKTENSNLYLLHPIFFVNGTVILSFFIPFVFFIFNEDLFYQRWCGVYLFSYTWKPLIIFCISVVFFNLICYFFENVLLRKNKPLNMENLFINIKRNELQILAIIYAIIWVMRLFSLYTGSYWHVFTTPEIILKRASYARFTSFLGFFAQVLAPIIWLMFWSLYFTKYKLNKKYRTFLISFVILEILFHIPTGSKYAVLMPLMTYFVVGFVLKQNIKKQFIIFTIIGILLWPVAGAYRASSRPGIPDLKKIEYITDPNVVKRGYLFVSTYSFMQTLEAFSGYFAFTNQCKNFLHGKSYIVTLAAPIPRPIWPSKPSRINWNKLGREYGVIGEFDFTTSPGLGIWTEAFFNFGYMGLFLMWIFISFIFLTLFKYMLKSKSIFGIALALYCPFRFLNSVDSSLASVFSGIIKLILVFTILNLIMKAVEKKK